MRDYGKVHTSFWASPTLQELDSDSKLLALYLLTSPHTTMTGAFRLPDAYVCEDLGWETKRFRNSCETLSQAGFIKYDSASKWIWVINFTRFNKPENPNVRKAAVRMAESIPVAIPFRSSVIDSLSEKEGSSERVSEPLRNTPSPSPSPYSSLEGGKGETILIPLEDGTDYPLTAVELAEFKSTYPLINPAAEARKARMWCVSNPANRKTRRGVGKFLNGWMGRAQKDAEKTAEPAPRQRRAL